MTTQLTASEIAQDWLDSWNRHDLDPIMSHYAEDVELTSPFVAQITGDPAGMVKGKAALQAYFAKGLTTYPDLRFELLQIFTGVNSFVLYYRSINNTLAAELMVLNSQGQVVKVMAHYCPDPSRLASA
jgi:ketosteroid isomerase-like protein